MRTRGDIQANVKSTALALFGRRRNIACMTRKYTTAAVVVAVACWTVTLIAADVAPAQAQFIPPGGSQFNPPPLPPPPPPKIEVPKIPKMDEVPRQSYQAPPRPSFGDRFSACLDEATASGLGPAERQAYARACANTR
jgi:hypothetical protein